MTTKNILKSKVFWLNVLVIINEIIKLLAPSAPTVSAETSIPIAAVGNILLRYFTSQVVTILPEPKERDW